jgi:hypothetical protein
MSDRHWINEAKARLPLPRLLGVLGMEAHAKKSAKCPFHEDGNASFSVYEKPKGWRFKCHAGCGEGEGDEIDFLRIHGGCGKEEAQRRFREMALGTAAPAQTLPPKASTPAPRQLVLPEDLSEGTRADWEQVAKVRNLSVFAVGWAAEQGTIRFGTVCGFRCWILTDKRGLCAEARRMCGARFPALGELPERKAHTLRGSCKGWPVGLVVRDANLLGDVHWMALVEGGPDYLAALHFALEGGANFLPVAMLGAGVSIHPEALPMFGGKRVRIFAHNDEKGQGIEAARKWGKELKRAGANADGWSFEGLRMADGQSVKDLNDCTRIHPEDAGKLDAAWL